MKAAIFVCPSIPHMPPSQINVSGSPSKKEHFLQEKSSGGHQAKAPQKEYKLR
jgi:hypothetical protein